MTEKARQRLEALSPILSETELECSIRETTEAREILEHMGTPPLVSMKDLRAMIRMAVSGSFLMPEQLEYLRTVLAAVRRLKRFLDTCKMWNYSAAFYGDELNHCMFWKKRLRKRSGETGWMSAPARFWKISAGSWSGWIRK